MGTPHYMAPEAAMGRKVDHRIDIYSLGATLFHLLSGKVPFTGTSATDVLKAQVMDPLPEVRDLSPSVPEPVVQLVKRLTAKKPEDRPQTAQDVIEEVRRIEVALGMTTDRIPAGETLILRRYVQDRAQGVEAVRATPGQGTGAPTTENRGAPLPRRGGGGVLAAVILLALVAAGGAAAWMWWPKLAPLLRRPQPTPPPTQVAGTATPPGPTVPAPQPQPPQQAAPDPGLTAALGRLGELERLLAESSRADLAAAERLLAGLADAPLPEAAAARRARAQGQVQKLQAARGDAQAAEAFAELERGVNELTSRSDYPSALARIEAFPQKAVPSVAPRVAELKARTERVRDEQFATLKAKVRRHAELRNAVGLRTMLQQLPPALLGGELEQEINAALKQLDQQQAQRHQQVVARAEAGMRGWDLPGVEEIVRQERTGMGASDAGTRLDAVLAATRQLRVFADAVSAQLKRRKVPVTGAIRGLANPTLVSADADGVDAMPEGDTAVVTLPWSKCSGDDLTRIGNAVLGAAAMKDHQAALAELAPVAAPK
jgi:hypothetical protein